MSDQSSIITTKSRADFVRIILKPNKDTNIYNYFSVNLWVRRDWWKDNVEALLLEDNGSKKPITSLINQFIAVYIIPDDMRVRHLPYGLSSFDVLKRTLQINQHALDLGFTANTKVLIEKIDENGLEARIISGAITFSALDKTFPHFDLSWLWANNSKRLDKLVLGHANFQMYVNNSFDANKSMYEYIGLTNNGSGILWQMKPCAKNPKISNPEVRLKVMRDNITNELEAKKAFVVQQMPEESAVYLNVKYDGQSYIAEEFFKSGIVIYIKNGKTGAPTTVWKPLSLKRKNGDTYELLDYDEIKMLLQNNQTVNIDQTFNFQITWEKNGEGKVSSNFVSEENFYLATITPEKVVNDNFAWQLADISCQEPAYPSLTNLPSCWVRHKLNHLSARNSKQTSGKINWASGIEGDKFHFVHDLNNDEKNWEIRFSLEFKKTDSINRFLLQIKPNKVVLFMRKPEITITSPDTLFYAGPVSDAKSVPAEQKYYAAQYNYKGNFIFKNGDIEYGEIPISMKLAKNEVNYNCETNSFLTLFAPVTQDALVDSVSASGGNLQIKQKDKISYLDGMVELINITQFDANNGQRATITFIDRNNIMGDTKYDKLWLKVKYNGKHEIRRIIKHDFKDDTPHKMEILGDWSKEFMDFVKTLQSSGEAQMIEIEILLTQEFTERDNNHGLVPINLRKFALDFSQNPLKIDILAKEEDEKKYPISPESINSVQALFPWSETKIGSGETNTDPFEQQSISLFHRNLILEHSEYAVAKEYQTQLNDHFLLDAEAFKKAVRDRYCLAMGDLLAPTKMQNWLANAKYMVDNHPIEPNFTYTNVNEFPELISEWPASSLNQQILSINTANNWLEYDVKPEYDNSTKELKIHFKKTDTNNHANGYRRITNSSAPLLFINDIASNPQEKFYYDNLGVIRSFTKKDISSEFDGWIIKEMQCPETDPKTKTTQNKTYYSVSVNNKLLHHDIPNLNKPSQLIFSADGLVVRDTGEIVHAESSDFPFNQGVYGFFSNITSDAKSAMKQVDYWPRYKGIPFYVVKLTKFDITNASPKITFQAVFANPNDLYVNVKNEKYTFTDDKIPGFVTNALLNKAVVNFEYDFSSQSLTLVTSGSTIHWRFDLQKQEMEPNTITAKLADIFANVSIKGDDVILNVNKELSHAVALGRIWKFKNNGLDLKLKNNSLFITKSVISIDAKVLPSDNPRNNKRLKIVKDMDLNAPPNAYVGMQITKADGTLIGHILEYTGQQVQKQVGDTSFIITVDQPISDTTEQTYIIKRYLQTNYEFQSEFAQENLHIHSLIPLEYNRLEIGEFKFEDPISKPNYNDLSAHLMNKSILQLALKDSSGIADIELEPDLVQGMYYGFKNNTYQIALTLWLETYESNNKILAGCLIEPIKDQIDLPVLNNDDVNSDSNLQLTGQIEGIRTFYSNLKDGALHWRESEIVSGLLTGATEKYEVKLLLNDQLFWDNEIIASKENEFILCSAYLNLKVKSTEANGHVQLPIQLKINKTNNDYKCIINSNYYFAKPIKLDLKNKSKLIDTKVDVIFSTNSTTSTSDNKVIKMLDVIQDRENPTTGFTKFNFNNEFSITIAQAVPLNLCLEKEAIKNLPKQQSSIPQLLHRLNYGNRSRLDLSEYQPLVIRNEAENPSRLNISTTANWLLSPVLVGMGSNKRSYLFEDNYYLLDHLQQQNAMVTENLFVISRRANASFNNNLPLVNLLNLSIDGNSTPIKKELLQKGQISKRILESGAAGIALRFIIKPTGKLNYKFVESPFYSEANDNDQDNFNQESFVFKSLWSENQQSIQIDISTLAPNTIRRLTQLQEQTLYHCGETSKQAYAEHSCAPMRQMHFDLTTEADQHVGLIGKVNRHAKRYYPDTWQPSVYLHDAVAFEDMESLWYVPTTMQQISQQEKDPKKEKEPKKEPKKEQLSEYFLPHQLDVSYGSDKPGAMFHHQARCLTSVTIKTTPESTQETTTSWILSPNIDFAIREPQQIKTDHCVTAKLTDLAVIESVPSESTHVQNIKTLRANWSDVIGTVNLADCNLAADIKIKNKPIDEKHMNFEFEENVNPLELIVQHDNNIMNIAKDAYSIPAYRYPKDKRLWANMYLATKDDDLNVTVDKIILGSEKIENVLFKPYISTKTGVVVSNNANIFTTKDPHGLETNDQVIITGITTDIGKPPGPWTITRINDKEFSIDATVKSVKNNANYYLVKNFDHYTTIISTGSPTYQLRKLAFPVELITADFKLQFIWVANLKIKDIEEPQPTYFYQCGIARVFSKEKFVKCLMGSIVTPQIAGILRAKNNGSKIYEKTIFFGNAAPVANGDVQITDDYFEYIVPDNNTTTVPYPSTIMSGVDKQFYLVKYLTHGQVIHVKANVVPN